MQQTIVIVEDTTEIADFVKEVLTDNGYLCYTAKNAVTGIQTVTNVKPELVLLDLNLPDLTGTDVFRKIKEMYPEIQVIMFTAESDPGSVARGLNMGADDYITKPVDTNVLLARVSARLRTTSGNSANILKIHDLIINESSHEVSRANKNIELTAQEFKLLVFLAHNKNRVVSREMILSRIWDGNPDIETRVVDVYIGYLRKKIDFVAPKLLQSKRGFGYILKD